MTDLSDEVCEKSVCWKEYVPWMKLRRIYFQRSCVPEKAKGKYKEEAGRRISLCLWNRFLNLTGREKIRRMRIR